MFNILPHLGLTRNMHKKFFDLQAEIRITQYTTTQTGPLQCIIQTKHIFEHFFFQQNVGDLLIVLHSVWIMGCWWFLSLMKANVIVHFRNHTFFYLPNHSRSSVACQSKNLLRIQKAHNGDVVFQNLRTFAQFLKPYFFLHLIQKMIDIRADEFLKTCSAIVFLGGRRGFHFFFFFKYIL